MKYIPVKCMYVKTILPEKNLIKPKYDPSNPKTLVSNLRLN